MSIIKYDTAREEAKLEKKSGMDNRGFDVFEVQRRDWRGLSYQRVLDQGNISGNTDAKKDPYWLERGYLHDPDYLDDPEMIHGASKQVMFGDARTGPVICSTILFKNPDELKRNLNEQFRENHPDLPSTLTLSKIRKLKKRVLLGCMNELDIEVSTVAVACIYFEQLCMKGIVSKPNRRLSMAVCLLIAFKLNEPTTGQLYLPRLEAMLRFLDTELSVNKTDIFKAEFGALVHLNFALQVPYLHVLEMFKRLLKLVHKTPRAYLSEEIYAEFNQVVQSMEHAAAVGEGTAGDSSRVSEEEIREACSSRGTGLKCRYAFYVWLEGRAPDCACCLSVSGETTECGPDSINSGNDSVTPSS